MSRSRAHAPDTQGGGQTHLLLPVSSCCPTRRARSRRRSARSSGERPGAPVHFSPGWGRLSGLFFFLFWLKETRPRAPFT